MRTTKTRLAVGVATIALAVSLAAPAQAACTVDGSTVTCSSDSTAAEVNAALAAAGGTNVTLNIAANVDVVPPNNEIRPLQQGQVAIANAGDIGTDPARVNVFYIGQTTATGNTFSLANTGSISGNVAVFSVGGATTIDNDGFIGNGVTISTSGTGPVTVTSTGDIDADGSVGLFVGTRGDVDVFVAGDLGTVATDTTASDLKDILVFSSQSVTPVPATTSVTTGTATTTTTTNAASSVTRVGGAVAVELAAGANSGAITANGLGGSTVVVDGTVGSETDYQNVNANSNNFDQSRTIVNTVDGANFANSDTTVRTAVGGAVSIAIGETGSVSGNLNANGLDGATVTVAGSVGTEDAPASVFAGSSNFDRTFRGTNARQGTVTTNTFDQVDASVGGIASIAVAEGGSVSGGVSTNGVGGADISIAGTVGLEDAASFANANSTGNANTYSERSTFDSATGASTFAQDSSSSSNGGDAAVTVGETGTLYGSASANANGDASVANAGYISGNVFATAAGNASTFERSSQNDGRGNTANAEFSTSTTTGGTASVDNAAGALIGESATSPVFVSASGDTAASITNAGRINGNASVESSGQATSNFQSSTFASATDTAGVVTTTTSNNSVGTSTNLGGDAVFANEAGGLLTGSVNVNGSGSATVSNEGAVIGTTTAVSSAQDQEFASARDTTTVFVPGASGGRTLTEDYVETFRRASTGGDVTGVYAGTNGAVQFAPFGGASDGSVGQFANGDSTALVSGAIFGNFTGNATGEEFEYGYADTRTSTFDADGDRRTFQRAYSYEESNRQNDSDSSLVVDGGRITGSASLYATGSAGAQVGDGGEIDGSLSVTAQGFGGYDYGQTFAQTQTFDANGAFTGSETVVNESLARIANTGTASVAIGDGRVGGSVFINGAAGTNSFSLARDGVVGGSVSQSSGYNVAGYNLTRRTVATPTRTTVTTERTDRSVAAGGNVTANVAGLIGLGSSDDPLEYGDVDSAGGSSLSLFTNAGNASVTLTGQVRNGIFVNASGTNSTVSSQQTQVNGATTAFAEQRSNVATGGTASLTVNAAGTDIPANFGNIVVSGRAGSNVTIGANSTVLAATDGAFMQVGGNFADTTSSRTDTYTGAVLTGQSQTFTSTTRGGPATLVNSGRIGFDGGADFDGDDAFVLVVSPTAASATNNGAIYGSIAVNSLFEDFSSSTTRTNLNDVTRVDTTTRTYRPGGGTATLTNGGLITGDASVAAINGVVTNNGVIRGDLQLGGSVDNYTTRSVDTLTQLGEEEVLDLATAIAQGYAVAQNGFVGGTIGVSGAFGQIDDEVRTSNITAVINLNNGSVTGGGVEAEVDDETNERFTNTTVNLNGAGYLGIGDIALDALEDRFGSIDPQIMREGDLSAYAGGARVLGVQALNKTGAGVFLITGADFRPASNTNRLADYTLDIGTMTISGGEIQLDTATREGVFGIRGNVVNNAGLVLGARVSLPAPLFGTSAAVTAIDGVEVYQRGNFTQSSSGTLTVGITPSLVRVSDPSFASTSFSTSPLAVQQVGLASGLFTTPERAFGQAFTDLGTGFLTLDGNLNLAGRVQLVSPTGGLFTNGQRVDIASVSGTVSATATAGIDGRSNFVTFGLGTRSEGGRTIVFVNATRVGFETVAPNQNAAAAGSALSAALPDVVAAIRAGSAGGIGLGGDRFALSQDLANIFVAFDTLATKEQVAQALNELASGEFYGSLTGISTTAPFVDAITSRRLPQGATGFNLWFAPSGEFAEYEGDAAIGSFDVDASNYGGSMGFGIATGSGEIGLGFGYGRIEADSRGDLLQAQADTWMAGAYARQEFGPIAVGAELVYGWSKWDAGRTMPLMSREASAEFDSSELRGTLHAEYMLDFGGGWVAPFGQLEFRKFDFDGFTEEGAGAVNLVVEEAKDTVLSPSLGVRAGTSFETGMATVRPEVSLSYTFQGESESFRDVAFLGAPDRTFRLQGIRPDDYFTIGAGVFAGIGPNSGAFLRGGYTTGKNVKVASVNAGVTIGF